MRLLQRSLGWQSVFRTSSRPSSHQQRLVQDLRQSLSRRYRHEYKQDFKIQIDPKKKIIIGERILVYHAGVFFTTFVGLLKVGSILWFAYQYVRLIYWGTKRNTYEFYSKGYQPMSWRAIGFNLAIGAAPLLIIWRLKPFVASAILGPIPVGARRSPQHLSQWLKKLPYDTEIEFKMFHDYGLFRRVSVPIGELQKQNPGLISMANLVRPRHARFSIWRFLVIPEKKLSPRKRIWDKAIIPQLSTVEEMRKEAVKR